jgi:3-oxoacyl-[acyl-carrier protein] reductase
VGSLEGQVAIVTGAGTAVGRELARVFARLGALVVAAGRRIEPLEETVAPSGGDAVHVDVTSPESVRALMDGVVDRHGRIDIVFANAGSFASVAPAWEADPDAWWQDAAVNLRGTMLCARYAVPHMIAAGSGTFITMNGGGGGDGVNLGGSGYATSKAGVVRFTENLARELEAVGSPVLSVGISPGFVRSEMTEGLIASPERAQWQPWVVEHLGSAERPASDCAEATLRMLAVVGPDLNGCMFSVDTDFDEVDRRRAEYRAKGIRTMGLRNLGPG